MWEVFNPISGHIIATVETQAAAHKLAKQIDGADYDHALAGFYVVGMSGRAVAGPYAYQREAEQEANIRNLGSDNDSFHVSRAQ